MVNELLKKLPDKMENRDWAIEYVDKAGVVEDLDERNRLLRAFDDHLDWIRERLGYESWLRESLALSV